MEFVITKATVTQAKAKIALVGPAGAGKTYTSLTIARELGAKTLVIDTENGTSAKYAGEFDFDILPLTDYRLTTYIAALEYAAPKGYDTVIVDSLSHAWAGPGGALEQVDNAPGKNKFTSGWKIVTPLYNQLVEAILSFPTHLIATMRMKTQYILTTNEKGQQVPQKAGMGIVQRDGIEYEFDVIAEMNVAHDLAVTKTRCSALDEFSMNRPDGTIGQAINAWLSEGVEAPVWPDGWYPSKERFFDKVRDQYGWSYKVIAEKLKIAKFLEYKPGTASDMWRALEADVDTSPTAEEDVQSLIDGGLVDANGPDMYK
ncbi:hypothetical protein LCGC14_0983860 [marine sediment metagenome]|uniref:AAA+ ATPase domain-containing protein n=1 Tax=marine sediment metagenome TaxID=412755 RepID=A0A0F9J2C8_9ZZZZ